MDERMLFDRFHDALDIEPNPGGYERLRISVLNQPDRPQARRAFRMRFTKMSFRTVAALTAAAIAAAVIAGFTLSHRATPVGNNITAGPDANTVAYQKMIKSDYQAFVASTSNHCATIEDTGCAAAAVPVNAAMQKWVGDMSAFHTPARYVALDALLRQHLGFVIDDLSAALAFQKAGDAAGFDFSHNDALYERAWIDPAVFAIQGSYPRLAGSFHDAVLLIRQSLDACINGTPGPNDLGCAHLESNEACPPTPRQSCAADLQQAATQIQQFLIALAQNPAPAKAASEASQLETSLAAADAGLETINAALLSGDSAKVSAGETAYENGITAAQASAGSVSFA